MARGTLVFSLVLLVACEGFNSRAPRITSGHGPRGARDRPRPTRLRSSSDAEGGEDEAAAEAARIEAFRKRLTRQMGGSSVAAEGPGGDGPVAKGEEPGEPGAAKRPAPSPLDSLERSMTGAPPPEEVESWARPLLPLPPEALKPGTLLLGNPAVFCSVGPKKIFLIKSHKHSARMSRFRAVQTTDIVVSYFYSSLGVCCFT